MVPAIESALRQLFAGRPEVDVVAVFGSTATGWARPDSDLDLYVRLVPGAAWPLAHQLAVTAAAAAAAGREVDLVVEDAGTSVILRREVANHGRPLYEARPGAWRDLRAAAGIAYADLEPYLRRIGDAARARARSQGERHLAEPQRAAAPAETQTPADLPALLGAMLAETGGPLTTAERRAADAVLGAPPGRPRRRE